MLVNYISHYVRKTFLHYLVIGVTYLVLILKSETQDWAMIGNIFGSAIVGLAIQNWWLMSYSTAVNTGMGDENPFGARAGGRGRNYQNITEDEKAQMKM